MDNENRLDDKDLSILGYKQRISELVTEYEEKILELRVALTRAQEQINEIGQAFMASQQDKQDGALEEPEEEND